MQTNYIKNSNSEIIKSSKVVGQPSSLLKSSAAGPSALQFADDPASVASKSGSIVLNKSTARASSMEMFSPCFAPHESFRNSLTSEVLSNEFSAVKARLEVVQQKLMNTFNPMSKLDVVSKQGNVSETKVRHGEANVMQNSPSFDLTVSSSQRIAEVFNVSELWSSSHEVHYLPNAANMPPKFIPGSSSPDAYFRPNEANMPSDGILVDSYCHTPRQHQQITPTRSLPLGTHLSPNFDTNVPVKGSTKQSPTLPFPPGLDPVPFSDVHTPIKLSTSLISSHDTSNTIAQSYQNDVDSPAYSHDMPDSYIHIDFSDNVLTNSGVGIPLPIPYLPPVVIERPGLISNVLGHETNSSHAVIDDLSSKEGASRSIQTDLLTEALTQQFEEVLTKLSSSKNADKMAGLCKLSLFFESNHRFILWDSLQQVCSELLSCIPDSNQAQTLYFDEDILIWDMACHCLGIMCRESAAVLEHARLHHAVPKILNLLNTQEATLRNTACRALIVLTDSIEDLKHFLINHDVTRDVLLQQMSSFDDELKIVAMTLLARSVYGCSPNIKAKVFTDDLLRVVSECISRMPSQALVGRAACILLCNLLAGCDSNVDKATRFGTLRVLAVASSKENNSSMLSCLLCAMMNFPPTAANLSSITAAGGFVSTRLSEFLSCSDPVLSHNSLRMLGWNRIAEKNA